CGDTEAPLPQRPHYWKKEPAFVSTPATTVFARLLPDATMLRLDAYEVDKAAAQITLAVQSTQPSVRPVRCAPPRPGASIVTTHAPCPPCPGRRIGCAFACACVSGFAPIAPAAAVSSPNGYPPSRPPGRGARCGSLSACSPWA